MQTSDLIRLLGQDKRPVNRLPPPLLRFTRWLIIAGIVVGGATAYFGLRGDWREMLFMPRYFLQLAATLGLALFSGLSAMILSHPGKRPRLLLLLSLFTLITWIAIIGHFAYHGPDKSAPIGLGCAKNIVYIGLIPGGLLFAMMKRGAVLNAVIAGTLAILSSAALAAAGVQLMCPHNEPLHDLFWHFLPVLAFALFGGLLGWRALRWRG